mmetsp:Transcript_39682/g.94029  ORF Transcript_39682/g.94029 Transcript_39682/m.94029 type:complete len:224 (+) Transcript_39682:1029-1700(+)
MPWPPTKSTRSSRGSSRCWKACVRLESIWTEWPRCWRDSRRSTSTRLKTTRTTLSPTTSSRPSSSPRPPPTRSRSSPPCSRPRRCARCHQQTGSPWCDPSSSRRPPSASAPRPLPRAPQRSRRASRSASSSARWPWGLRSSGSWPRSSTKPTSRTTRPSQTGWCSSLRCLRYPLSRSFRSRRRSTRLSKRTEAAREALRMPSCRARSIASVRRTRPFTSRWTT